MISLPSPSLNYRADIDGLRAVAVLSVLCFHVGVFRATGGFVGVDVFFVISGYLLSAIVMKDIASSKFSIISFYERRIRRILPGLFGMLVCFTIFAWIYLLPDSLVLYSKSLLASTIFVSNVFFWQHSGYFDAPNSNPLLHTWSLAVEEQFYILFPVFIVLARRFFLSYFRAAVVSLFLISLVSSSILAYTDRSTAFYMIYTRAWELLLGTILALGVFPRLNSTWLRNLVTLGGLGMIAYSVWFYTETTIFPGVSALLPCVGAALIIGAGESGGSLICRILSFRPVVFIGLISYSLYLWHWPVVILQRMGVLLSMADTLPSRFAAFLAPQQYDKLVQIMLSVVLAAVSWAIVERPFRIGRLRLKGWPLFASTAVVMGAFAAFSLVTVFANGFTGRFPAEAVEIASDLHAEQNRNAMREGSCFLTSAGRFMDFDANVCLQRDADRKTYLLVGDSHAAALWHGLSSALPTTKVMQATMYACAPLVDQSQILYRSDDCRRMRNYIFNDYLQNHQVDGLFLAARWQARDIERLRFTIEWAKQRHVPVTVFGPVPEYDMPLPLLLAYSLAWKKPDLADRHRIRERGALDLELRRLSNTVWRVPYVSLHEAICPDGRCMLYSKSDSGEVTPLMFDNSHLTASGSSTVMRDLVSRGVLSL